MSVKVYTAQYIRGWSGSPSEVSQNLVILTYAACSRSEPTSDSEREAGQAHIQRSVLAWSCSVFIFSVGHSQPSFA
jgi:hypothetical protein